MEHIIAKLVQDFEQGKMSRRQLIKHLTAAATVISTVGAATAATGTGFKGININHISFHVPDYTKMRDFYAGLFGMKVSDDTGKKCSLLCGTTKINISTNAPNMKPEPHFDHMAIEIEGYDRKVVEAELNHRGIHLLQASQMETFNNGDSPKIKDRDGFTLQIAPKGYTGA